MYVYVYVYLHTAMYTEILYTIFCKRFTIYCLYPVYDTLKTYIQTNKHTYIPYIPDIPDTPYIPYIQYIPNVPYIHTYIHRYIDT